MSPGEQFDAEVAGDAAEVFATLREVSEAWGGVVHGDGLEGPAALEIPVVAGLRRGRLRALLSGRSDGEHTTVHLEIDRLDLRLNVSAVAILLLSAAGGLASVLWPWFPTLLPAVPLGLVLAVGGWLLVAGRLRSSGVDEFLLAVRGQGAKAASDRMDASAGNSES